MLKIISLCLLVFSLAGCSCSMGGSTTEPTMTPSSTPTPTSNTSQSANTKEAIDVLGEESDFGTPIVSLKLEDGKIVDLNIDEIYENSSKKELGDEYKLSDSAVAPWHVQIQSLEDYIMANGVESVELSDGKVVNTDLMTSVTISVENYIKTVNKAIDEAK